MKYTAEEVRAEIELSAVFENTQDLYEWCKFLLGKLERVNKLGQGTRDMALTSFEAMTKIQEELQDLFPDSGTGRGE